MGLNYNDEWYFLNEFIAKKAREQVGDLKIYLGKVVSSEGRMVEVKIAGDPAASETLKNIPVLQSKYDTQITQEGDLGLLLNLHQDISSLLGGLEPSEELPKWNFFVFLPIMSEEDYINASERGVDAEHKVICSPDTKTFLKIGNDGLVLEVVENMELKITKNTELKTQKLTITAEDPIELGTSETLGAVLADLCDALQGFQSLPVAPNSPAVPDPGFITKITQISTKLKQILK